MMFWSLVLLIAGTSGALAQQTAKSASEAVFLVQLVVLMLAGRLLGEAMRRLGQPSVMGQLLAGILLGRRPGQKLLLGNTAAAIFETAPASAVFLAI